MLKLLLRLSVIAAAVFFVTDCGQKSQPLNEINSKGNGLKADDISPTLSSIYANILSQNCVTCHSPATASTAGGGSGLDFTDEGTSYRTLHGPVSGVSSPDCHGLKVVVGGNPAGSYLMAVISSDYSSSNFAGRTSCTPYALHQTNQNLSASEIAAINGWIAAGAQNN